MAFFVKISTSYSLKMIKNDIESDQEDEEEDNNDDNDHEEMIFTSKLQRVLAAKSRRLQYTSSPVISRHVPSLSLLSLSASPDRASVPFSWEDEPGKPKDYLLPSSYNNSKRLGLPPRMVFPREITKIPLVSDRHRRRLVAFKRWLRRKKERARDVVFPSTENDEDDDDEEDDTRIKRLHCISDVTKCFFWKVPWSRS